MKFFEKNSLIVSIYGLHLSFKCSFKSVEEKNSKFFTWGANLLCVLDEMFIEVTLFQEISPALENSWFRAWTDVAMNEFLFRGVPILFY